MRHINLLSFYLHILYFPQISLIYKKYIIKKCKKKACKNCKLPLHFPFRNCHALGRVASLSQLPFHCGPPKGTTAEEREARSNQTNIILLYFCIHFLFSNNICLIYGDSSHADLQLNIRRLNSALNLFPDLMFYHRFKKRSFGLTL